MQSIHLGFNRRYRQIGNSIRHNLRTVPLMAALVFTTPTQANAQKMINISLPAGTLRDSLMMLANDNNLELVYETNLAEGLKTKALQGRYTLEQALKKLLVDTDIHYRIKADKTVILSRAPQVSFTTESLLAAAGEFVLAKNQPIDDERTSPIEQEDITVQGDEWNSYNALDAYTGTKTDVKLFDTPVSVQVVPKTIIDDQQAIGLGDVVQNVSGVSKNWGFGVNADSNFLIRGFRNTSIYRDGILTPNNINISLANTQRVEVLKGPAGMLFGRTEPGGLVNVVTKRPQAESYYSLQQQFGSYDTYRTLLDATGSINQSGSLLYRLNYEHLDSHSFRDYFFDDSDFIAPSFTWHISEDTQLDVDFMYQNRESTTDSGIPSDLQQSGIIPGKIPINFRGNEPSDYSNSEFFEGDVTLTHHLNDDWKIRTRFSVINHDTAAAQTPSNGNADLLGNLRRGFLKNSNNFDSQYVTADLTGHFTTWALDHTLLMGADYYHSSNDLSSSTYRTTVPTINVFQPVYGFTQYLNDPLTPSNTITNEWYGIYIQDQVALGDKWQLLFGGRFDHAEFGVANASSDRKKQVDEFSPRVGLLYHPVSWLGIYADYVETFNAVNQGTTISGDLPDPEKSREYEVGLKGEWLEGRLSANLAFYELTKTNVQTPLPAPFTNRVAVTGEQRSRGIELDLRGQLSDYWNLIATYAYTDAEVTKDSGAFDFAIGSSGAGNTGHRLQNIPRHSGSVWTTYDFSGFGAQGFSAGAGVFLVDERAGNLDNTFKLPGYARVDTYLKYQSQLGPSKLTLQFNIQNLLDDEYFESSNGGFAFIHQTLPGAPRTFLGSVKLEF